MTWIQTYTGIKFDLLNPTVDMVNILDIAHALSNLCRFTGHTPTHYSVAQHSYLTSKVLPSEFRLEGLLHDAAEAYVGDMSSPLKRCKGMSAYRKIEENIHKAIAEKYGIPYTISPEVKEADCRMLATEKGMLGKEPQAWGIKDEPYDMAIVPWDAVRAKDNFLDAFYITSYGRVIF